MEFVEPEEADESETLPCRRVKRTFVENCVNCPNTVSFPVFNTIASQLPDKISVPAKIMFCESKKSLDVELVDLSSALLPVTIRLSTRS